MSTVALLLRNENVRKQFEKKLFKRFDIDHNGELSLEEAYDLVCKLCDSTDVTRPSEEKAKAVFKKSDKSRNGGLDPTEFDDYFVKVLHLLAKTRLNMPVPDVKPSSQPSPSLDSSHLAQGLRCLTADQALMEEEGRGGYVAAAETSQDQAKKILEQTGNAFKNDREIVLKIIESEPSLFKSASEDCKKDPEIVLKAIAKQPDLWQYASEACKNDQEIELEAIRMLETLNELDFDSIPHSLDRILSICHFSVLKKVKLPLPSSLTLLECKTGLTELMLALPETVEDLTIRPKSDARALEIAPHLGRLSALKTVDLSSAGGSHTSYLQRRDYVGPHGTSTTYSLSGVGWAALMGGLPPSIKKLDLSHNYIGSDDLICIAKNMTHLKSIKILHINHCENVYEKSAWSSLLKALPATIEEFFANQTIYPECSFRAKDNENFFEAMREGIPRFKNLKRFQPEIPRKRR